MQVTIDEHSIRIRLALWQKVLGLMRDIDVPLERADDVGVVEEPVRQVRAAGLMVGLRVPGLYYVARTIRLDEAFIVRRGVPALSFTVDVEGPLRRVLVSSPEAHELAAALRPGAASVT